jgi:hypothetical protein
MKKNIGFWALGVLLVFGFVSIGCDTGTDKPTDGPTGDTTAPVLSLQAVAEYMDTADGDTATVVFTSNEAGSYYVKILDSASAAPNASALAGSGLMGSVAANTAQTVDITGLTRDLAHKAYVTVKDAAGNYSAVWSSDSFTPTKYTGSSLADTNPFVGTIIYKGSGSFQGYPYTATCTVTGTVNNGTFETKVTVTGGFIPPFVVTSGTYDYKGNPIIWTVTDANSQYTTLKIGDKGIAKEESNGDVTVFNFVDPIANGRYTKQ